MLSSVKSIVRYSRSRAYNCGAGNVARARKETEKRGLDPNKWCNNVELVVGEQIGMQTTTYVGNIYKCYVDDKPYAEARAEAEKGLLQAAPNLTATHG